MPTPPATACLPMMKCQPCLGFRSFIWAPARQAGTGLSVTTAFASEVLVAQIVPLRASAPAFEKAVAVTPIPGARKNSTSPAKFPNSKHKFVLFIQCYRLCGNLPKNHAFLLPTPSQRPCPQGRHRNNHLNLYLHKQVYNLRTTS